MDLGKFFLILVFLSLEAETWEGSQLSERLNNAGKRKDSSFIQQILSIYSLPGNSWMMEILP